MSENGYSDSELANVWRALGRHSEKLSGIESVCRELLAEQQRHHKLLQEIADCALAMREDLRQHRQAVERLDTRLRVIEHARDDQPGQ